MSKLSQLWAFTQISIIQTCKIETFSLKKILLSSGKKTIFVEKKAQCLEIKLIINFESHFDVHQKKSVKKMCIWSLILNNRHFFKLLTYFFVSWVLFQRLITFFSYTFLFIARLVWNLYTMCTTSFCSNSLLGIIHGRFLCTCTIVIQMTDFFVIGDITDFTQPSRVHFMLQLLIPFAFNYSGILTTIFKIFVEIEEILKIAMSSFPGSFPTTFLAFFLCWLRFFSFY